MCSFKHAGAYYVWRKLIEYFGCPKSIALRLRQRLRGCSGCLSLYNCAALSSASPSTRCICSVHVDRKYLRLASRLLQSIFFILHSEFRKVLNTVLCERFENDASGLRGFRCTNLELCWSMCSLCYKNHMHDLIFS